MSEEGAICTPEQVPLVVDLDGTFLLSDSLHESLLELLRSRPIELLKTPFWLLAGKAGFKRRLAKDVPLDTSSMPVNQPLLKWLEREHARGRQIYLASAADQAVVDAVVEHHTLFSEGFGSDGRINNAGERKAQQLTQRFGPRGFEYAGNASVDIPIWLASRHAHLVNVPKRLASHLESSSQPLTLHSESSTRLRDLVESLRPQQWLKNLLVFVPLLTAHVTSADSWLAAFLAALALSLTASGVYLLNDLIDLPHDRAHPRKCLRPLPSGRVPLSLGLLISPLLMLSGLAIAASVSLTLAGIIALYLSVTTLYSLVLKRLALVDVFVLAGLYTLRIVAGAVAVGIAVSEWLLAFSIFIFLSLAILKRYGELTDAAGNQRVEAKGRGYTVADLRMLAGLGSAAAYAAVVILALYINSEAVQMLYAEPAYLWGVVGLVLFWLSRMLLVTHRGEMHDDPLVYAVRDRVSLGVATGCAVFFLLGI